MNAAIFVVLYVLFMLPTYYLPYLGSNSALVAGFNPEAMSQEFLLHVGSLVILFALAWYRGNATKRQWLVVFPFLAGVFDMVPGLSIIPLVPTAMHLAAVIIGATGASAVVVSQEEN